ncbi:ABC transporter permease [Solibacillus sp. R5-41]|uniref:ABC transporter permease n=1 Tax=Solibacillus sp. R5-41 TaxID=2048654 RepID=UPI000C128D5A|nr:ABC transporter permease subunit [Solibacillus sp. R5-41]ATP38675.1 ABC transporter permease [Solibacillus sp. R5-41]
MKQFNTLLLKEWRESLRSFKFIWIPIVFVLLGVSDPLLNYFLEDILNAVGNMPDGFAMMMPELQAVDLLAASMGQFQTIGLVVLIAAYIGTFSKERQNGTATLLYVRPISFTAMFLSKWIVASSVAIISATAGYAGSVYYTVLLYGKVDPARFLAMLGTYYTWLLLVMAITVAMSAAFKTPIATAITIILIPIGLFIDAIIGGFWTVTPYKLSTYGMRFIDESVTMPTFWWTLTITVLLMLAFNIIGIYFSKKRASTVKV